MTKINLQAIAILKAIYCKKNDFQHSKIQDLLIQKIIFNN
jgi:hypothetical protein